MLNKQKFYYEIRNMFDGGITSVQVKVIDSIIDGASNLTYHELAYIMATAYGEAKFTPQRENMSYSADRIRKVWPNRPEAIKFARNPAELAKSVYNGRLGNKPGSNDGWIYRGGGIDQCTGRVNYEKIGISENPDLILDPKFAVKSIIHGMTTGRYTGKMLKDYIKPDGFDFIGARAIINGDVKLNGKKYAGYAASFLEAINASDIGNAPSVTPPKLPSNNWLAVIIAAIIRMFGKVK